MARESTRGCCRLSFVTGPSSLSDEARADELGKNYEHKLTLISAELDKTAKPGSP